MKLYRNSEGTLIGDDGIQEFHQIYVRRDREQGFSEDEIVAIDAIRESIRNGDHIDTEAALDFARKIINQFK